MALTVRLTFVDGVYTVIAVILCDERVSEDVFRQIPVVFGIWSNGGELRSAIDRLPTSVCCTREVIST